MIKASASENEEIYFAPCVSESLQDLFYMGKEIQAGWLAGGDISTYQKVFLGKTG